MEKSTLLRRLARLASSLSLLIILVCFHLVLTLAHFLPAEAKIMDVVYIFFFAGIVLGSILCPVFLPLPNGKSKPLAMSMGFIGFLWLVECILRFQGVDAWISSAALRSIMAIPEGMLFAMSFGLFYLTWQQPEPVNNDEPDDQSTQLRTSKWCSLFFGAILLASVLVRYYSVPSLENGIAVADPLKGAEFAFNCITWNIIVMGLLTALSVFLVQKANVAKAASERVVPDWEIILRLVGLAAVFTLLNGVLNMPIFSLYSGGTIYHPHLLIVAAAVPLLGLLAGRSVTRFIRWLLPPSIVLFILISCMPLFEEHRWFNVSMSTLVAIAHYTLWVVFTTAVVEHYGGGFWFYGIAMSVFSSAAFAFLAPVINPLVPDDTRYRVLFMIIAAVLFMLLAFRLLFPKLPHTKPQSFPGTVAIEDIFKQCELAPREIEVAYLMVREGIGNKKIANRMGIAPGTVKNYVSTIYRKLSVRTRAEFMTLFMNRIEEKKSLLVQESE